MTYSYRDLAMPGRPGGAVGSLFGLVLRVPKEQGGHAPKSLRVVVLALLSSGDPFDPFFVQGSWLWEEVQGYIYIYQ